MVASEKWSAACILFGLAAVSGILPCVTVKCLILRLGSSTKFKRAIGVLNCLSGGVFFATSILDLLPEAREGMNHVLVHSNTDTNYPISELLMCIGFFMILSLEHIAHSCCSDNNQNALTLEQTCTVSKENLENHVIHQQSIAYVKTKPMSSSSPCLVKKFDDRSHLEDDDHTYHTYGTIDESVDKSSIRPNGDLLRSRSLSERQLIFQYSDQIVIKPSSFPTTKTDDIKTGIDSLQNGVKMSKIRGVVLLIALSLHMIFDGLALGLLQKSDKVWTLLFALSLHKMLMFYTIGMQALCLLASNRKTILLVVIFALISPIGIVIGESVSSSTNDEIVRDLATAILQGIATGTFLFVTFFEIFHRELGTGEHDLLKVFMAIFGFVLVALVRLLNNEEG